SSFARRPLLVDTRDEAEDLRSAVKRDAKQRAGGDVDVLRDDEALEMHLLGVKRMDIERERRPPRVPPAPPTTPAGRNFGAAGSAERKRGGGHALRVPVRIAVVVDDPDDIRALPPLFEEGGDGIWQEPRPLERAEQSSIRVEALHRHRNRSRELCTIG